MKILLATTNPAKKKTYQSILNEIGVDVVSLKDLDINIDVEETGNNSIENAKIKAEAYQKISGLPTIATDDCLYLNDVPDDVQPGPNVRRVNGKRLNDQEMVEHYINIANVHGKKGIIKGYFLKGIAFATEESTSIFESKASRIFVNKKSDIIDEGYPLRSIQYIQEFDKFKSELTSEEHKQTNNKELKPIQEFLMSKINKLTKEKQIIKN